MDQGTNNSGNTSSTGNTQRPAVLDNMSETQMLELERAYAESTNQYFDELAHSYGWSDQDTEAVRRHFAERVENTGGYGGTGNPDAPQQ